MFVKYQNYYNFVFNTFYKSGFFRVLAVFFYKSFIVFLGTLKGSFFNLKFILFYIYILLLTCSLYIWICFDSSLDNFQFLFTSNLLKDLGIIFTFGVDGFSLFFIQLVVFLAPLCVIWCWDVYKNNSLFFIFYFLIILLLIITFLVLDFFFFFFFFECLLIPMFLLVGFWGGRFRRTKAAYFLAVYTIVGSILLLLGIILLWLEFGTTNIIYLQSIELPYNKQVVLWVFLFFGFSVKVPLFPLHIWLPEAHVEAPTVGSVILAAFLLKLGGYGILRFVIIVLPFATVYMSTLVNTLGILGVIYCSLTALRQIDIKRIIAYSSVAHMNLGILGLFSLNLQGIEGFFFLMLAHGIVSAALFLLVGSLYIRYHSKNIIYYGGLSQVMPLFSIFFFFFSLANFSFPGTANFIGELLIILGVVKSNMYLTIIALLGILLSTCFSIVLFNRLVFGTVKNKYIKKYVDLHRREVYVLIPLVVFTMVLGFYPGIVLKESFITLKFFLNKILV